MKTERFPRRLGRCEGNRRGGRGNGKKVMTIN